MTFPPAPGARFPANFRRCSVCGEWKSNKGMKMKPKRVCEDCLAKEKT